MINKKLLVEGIRFLRSIQNTDKGIPATEPGIISGCWTSASALESMLTVPFLSQDISVFALDIVEFLCNTQFSAGVDEGGWPLVVGGTKASTMATGHAVSALTNARSFLQDHIALINDIDESIESGFRWLSKTRNDNGSWGVEPNGGVTGKAPRLISTTYALRAYFANSQTVKTSHIVRDGIRFILTLKREDSGFSGKSGESSDACNTARSVTAIIRSRHCELNDQQLIQSINYIKRARPKGELWPLDSETYVTEGVSGQTTYNSNTTADVLEAFVRAEIWNKNARDIIDWYVSHVEDNGSWFLGANDKLIRHVITWSTCEAVYCLSLAETHYLEKIVPKLEHDTRIARRVTFALGIIVVAQLLYLLPIPEIVSNAWSRLPDITRTLITQGIILALLVNLAASFFFDRIKGISQSFGRK